jgi:hypothetical protein
MDYNIVLFRIEIIFFLIFLLFIGYVIFLHLNGIVNSFKKAFLKPKKQQRNNKIIVKNKIKKEVYLHKNDFFIKTKKISNDDKSRI